LREPGPRWCWLCWFLRGWGCVVLGF